MNSSHLKKTWPPFSKHAVTLTNGRSHSKFANSQFASVPPHRRFNTASFTFDWIHTSILRDLWRCAKSPMRNVIRHMESDLRGVLSIERWEKVPAGKCYKKLKPLCVENKRPTALKWGYKILQWSAVQRISHCSYSAENNQRKCFGRPKLIWWVYRCRPCAKPYNS
jgi:hypothetical protein